jgi:hypothetical protein
LVEKGGDMGDVNIGPVGTIRGRIVGLRPVLHAVGSLTPTAIELAPLLAKGFNDAPAERIVGVHRGRVVKRSPGSVLGEEPFSTPEEEEAAFARAKQAGQQNRQFYRQTIGTPRRRPMRGGLGDDFSDIQGWTP